MASNTLISFDNLLTALDEYRAAVMNLYQEKLRLEDHIATGDLINHMTYHIVNGNQAIEVDLQLEDYWKYVENDTRPHWPPIDAILKWVKVKKILPSKTYDGKLPTEKQLAYLISRKISEKGTTGTHDLRDAMQAVNIQFEQRIGDAVAKDIEGALTSVLTELQTK